MGVYRSAKEIYIENVFSVISHTIDALAAAAFQVRIII